MGSRYREYLEYAEEYYRSEPTQRIGQAYANALSDLYPDMANELIGTDLDPFHNDSRLHEFLEAVEEQLDGRTTG